tara:strand:- start:106 stop:591 length:486 start_codon:yes stop_codon:yes gene_type:complete
VRKKAKKKLSRLEVAIGLFFEFAILHQHHGPRFESIAKASLRKNARKSDRIISQENSLIKSEVRSKRSQTTLQPAKFALPSSILSTPTSNVISTTTTSPSTSATSSPIASPGKGARKDESPTGRVMLRDLQTRGGEAMQDSERKEMRMVSGGAGIGHKPFD